MSNHDSSNHAGIGDLSGVGQFIGDGAASMTESNGHGASAKAMAETGRLWATAAGVQCASIEPLAGDVSARSYFRLSDGAGILAHYPPELRRAYDCFRRTTELLLRAGVPVPAIRVADPQRRWMITEDLGDHALYDEQDPGRIESAYDQAEESVRRIRTLPAAAVADLSPALETELLSREIRKTVSVHFSEALQAAEVHRLEAVAYELCERLGAGPLEPAHRDFMARNLMLPEKDGRIVVLDHQDLRLAPRGYDLASLCFDSSPLEHDVADRWLQDRVAEHDLEGVWRCAAQRALKIVGTFVGFARAGRPRYLPMVPRALSTAATMLSRLPEGDGEVVALLQRCAKEAPRD